jgi:Mg2+ and Co2+ transporter CorA
MADSTQKLLTQKCLLKTIEKSGKKIQRPQFQFAKFKRQIAKLNEDAERVERAIDRKLDLKTKHASLNEAHATAIMSAAVFGFTIITIIFMPLSFLVSLFALPID